MLEINKLSLRLINERNYTLNSTDNIINYDKYSYGIDCTKNNVVTKIGVRCTVTGTNILLMATGGASGVHKTCYVIDDDNIVICVSDSVFSLNIVDLTVNWVIQGDRSTCFQIYKCNGNYYVHGELGISCINSKWQIIWSFSGKDIFVTADGTDDFKIKDNKIYVTDWLNTQYILDLKGNLIR